MGKCLIIDDSEVICFVMRRIIEKLGHVAYEANTIVDAITSCKAHEPDFVMLDWDLPGLAALDFLKQVSSIDQTIRPAIVLCATENDAQQFALAKAAGAHFHVLKPFDYESVKEVLENAGFTSNIVENTAQTA